MRKIIFLFTFLLYFFQSYASHFLGGEITAKLLGSNKCVVTLTLYRDTLDIPIGKSVNINILDYNGAYLFTSYTKNKVVISENSIKYSSSILKIYTFSDTITFPGNGKYFITYDENNLTLKTLITNDKIDNSSPVFLTPPVFNVKANKLFTFNPLPYDPDGDSLHLSMDITPAGNMGSKGLFGLDTVNGSLYWTPDTVGRFILSIVVEEFRNGTKTGETWRYMQMNVKEDKSIIENTVFSIGNIYPNPVNSSIFLPVSLDKETKISLQILDILGNPVWKMPEVLFDSGKHLLTATVNLPNGQYLARIFRNGEIYKTQKIIVVK